MPSGGRHPARQSSLLVAVGGLCLVGPWLAGCPLPIARTVATSAPLSGVLTQADGTPGSGTEIATSVNRLDAPCARPLARTTTDSAGEFRLPGTWVRYGTTWFIPGFDYAAPSYELCVSIGDSLRPAYVGYGALGSRAVPDSVTCYEWPWEHRFRVSCAGRWNHPLTTGGRWTLAADTGEYRIIFTMEETSVRGRRGPVPQPHAYVEWIKRVGNGALIALPSTIALEIGPRVNGLLSAQFQERDGDWYAIIGGTKHAFMNDYARTTITFKLGPPGQAALVRSR